MAQIEKIAHSQEAKTLAKLGEIAIDKALNQKNETESNPSPNEPVELVTGRTATGQRDFNRAKQVLPDVFRGMESDFYCGCAYKGKEMDLASCGYTPRKSETRASRLEWEHVVPAWVLGHQRQCWQNGGRKNCSDNDPQFKSAEGNLVNLVPSVGEVNGDRSNFAYSAWTRNPEPMYGQCKTIVDFKNKKAQPREEVRGRIARIHFYMYERYQLKLSRQDQQLMCAWAKTYPVDDWEIKRDQRIVKLQGDGNHFVSERKTADYCA
ncbi:endonuclease [Iodobacter sp. HSC-16F04]|uniref:Endonuclease n=1 Tax=Iodobacter violaceini TaxID=3044271 RepID=A0ABX0KW32_9NEIS|nr:endonuclease [Iodobacter violacea]NHQ87999.1 endonuclease [Iodobacter violacea]